MLLQIDRQTTARGTTLRVAGEIDLASVPELREALDGLGDAPGELALDLTQVTFMDSTGLQLLLRLGRERADPERPWRLRASEPVERVCVVSGVAARLPLQPGPHAG